MQNRRIAPLALVFLVLVAGCTDGDDITAPALPGDALHSLSDGAHGGTQGFFFLPPMVDNPAYGGTFDAALQPVVEICKTTACNAIHASYSMTEGVGSEVVRLADAHHYIVNWHTNQTEAAAGQTYRVRVLVNALVLGYADVTVVSTGREAISVQSDGSIALVANQTLPVIFRIETGIVGAVVVSPAEATIDVGGTQQFSAALYDLHEEPLAGPTVTWSSDDEAVATVDATGQATGVDEGLATIIASAGPASGSAALTVAGIEPVGAWQAMGLGMNGVVYALTVYDGDVIAGGEFTTADGQSANRIARWNGSAWEPLGSGTDGIVFALTVFNGELIAGGQFTTAGGQAASRIARWDGSTWQAMGSGVVSGRVRGLAVYDGDLVAAGSFPNRVERWNGVSWQPMGTDINSEATTFAVLGAELIVSGFFTSAGGQTANRIARWNGSDWEAMSSGMNDRVFGLTFFEDTPVAGGWFTSASGQTALRIASWNGSAWEPIGSGMNGAVRDFATYGGDLIATGSFSQAGGQPANSVARWDGSAWHPLGTGIDGFVMPTIAHDGYLFVGGGFTTADGVAANRIARWGTP